MLDEQIFCAQGFCSPSKYLRAKQRAEDNDRAQKPKSAWGAFVFDLTQRQVVRVTECRCMERQATFLGPRKGLPSKCFDTTTISYLAPHPSEMSDGQQFPKTKFPGLSSFPGYTRSSFFPVFNAQLEK
uniref:Uncharacterized protein n=1 Tax=Romanomermis culicivorax TaxID=13658 RepID=A0A915K9B6_ROMCU